MKPNWILKKALIFISIYTLLLMLSEIGGLKNVVQKHVKGVASATLSSFGSGGEVSFNDIKKKEDKAKYKKYDILVNMTSKQQKDKVIAKARIEGKKTASYNPVKFGVNSWVHFGMILSFFIALVFAVPTGWKNKVFLFITGFIVLELFLIFKLWVSINLKYSVRYERFEVGWTNEFLIQSLNHVSNIVSFPFFGFLMMTILSVLFSYKKNEFKTEQIGPVLVTCLPTT